MNALRKQERLDGFSGYLTVIHFRLKVVELWNVDSRNSVTVTREAGQLLGVAEVGDVLRAGVDVRELHLWDLLGGHPVTGGGVVPRLTARLVIEPQPGVPRPSLARQAPSIQLRLDLVQPLLCVVLGCVQAELGRTDERFLAVLAAV